SDLIYRLDHCTGQWVRLLSSMDGLGTKSGAEQLMFSGEVSHYALTFCADTGAVAGRSRSKEACRSAQRSSTSSRPIANRTVYSVISPALASSGASRQCVVQAG